MAKNNFVALLKSFIITRFTYRIQVIRHKNDSKFSALSHFHMIHNITVDFNSIYKSIVEQHSPKGVHFLK